MRVDGEGKDDIYLSFDNMQSRPLKGNLCWEIYGIVLDIPVTGMSGYTAPSEPLNLGFE